MVAEKFEPLVAAAAVASAAERRTMGECAVKPRMVGEAIADALLELGDFTGGRAGTFAASHRRATTRGHAL